MLFRTHRRLVISLVGTLVAIAGASTLAYAGSPQPSASGPLDGDVPPAAVEDYAYPNASEILADKGILLKRGDGHIMLADCDSSANQIRVLTVADPSASRDEVYCFRVNAGTGHLTLELPRVFALETADHPISADLTANGVKTTVNVPEDGFKPVGEGTTGGVQSILVEIRVTG